jgi:hypothetical protein
MTPAERVARIEAEAVGSDLNSWEKHDFLPSIKTRHSLTEKQEKCLQQIERKLFGEEE